jgi:KipI family sensor histidine kinase inhibitor
MKIRACGDSMLLVELEPAIDPVINERAILLASRIRERKARGVRDIAPGYSTLGIHYDPLQTDLAALEQAIEQEFAGLAALDTIADRAVIEIPVNYGGEYGPDLDAVATFAGCSVDEVIKRHSSRTYRVYMLGFVPGFAYMGRVDPSLAAPRHRVPRERVPAGSVGIAGLQTGVYPVESPGGWQLIGHTTTMMFDANRDQPSLLSAGDLVRFVPAGNR